MAISRTRLLMEGIGDPALCHALTRRTIVIGDPGLLNIIRKIGGHAATFIPGVPAGVSRIIGGIRKPPKIAAVGASVAQVPPSVFGIASLAKKVGVGLAGSILGGAAAGALMRGRAQPTGTAAVAAGTVMGPGMRRRRHMRVTNVKALRRATRRVAGFHRMAVSAEAALSHLVRRRAHRRPSIRVRAK